MIERHDGSRDVAARIRQLEERLPEPLRPLARLAFNYRWCWSPGSESLFLSLDPVRWERAGHNPVRMLSEARGSDLERAAAHPGLLERVAAAAQALDEELQQPVEGPLLQGGPAAFLCAEFGVHASLPIYSGGLGGLAGDLLKEASDRRFSLAGVGLLYRQGYFHQRLDVTGWQHEYWITTDPERLPAALVTGADGAPLTVRVPIADREVVAQIWRVDVGRVPLYLLDAERPENGPVDRWITSRLYVGDRQLRLAQYLLLGVGGVRALRAMGIEPSVVHLNEGHAAFAVLELARERVAAGVSFEEALAAARARTIFTTHTPVAAGNESYAPQAVLDFVRPLVRELGVDDSALLRLARTRQGDESESFGVTQLALRVARSANAVSSRHGRVARAMWQAMWPDRPPEAVPITHVTNGVHLPTWMAPEMRELLDRFLPPGWMQRASDPAVWERVEDIPDAALWAVRNRLREQVIAYARERSVIDRLGRGDPLDYAEAGARTFDAGALTLGFARRLAGYKRLNLLTFDPTRALRLLGGGRAVQLMIAGKAHPLDDAAKRIVQQQLFPLRGHAEVGRHVAYLEDYDLAMAQKLVRGCDVWLNLPRPPMEASGTSGMKSALNGGLQLSILDGWWEEAFDGGNGWGIGGEPVPDDGAQDARDAQALYYLLENEVVPMFHDRDAAGIPRAWVRRIKQSLRTIGPRFNAGRMLSDYGAIYGAR